MLDPDPDSSQSGSTTLSSIILGWEVGEDDFGISVFYGTQEFRMAKVFQDEIKKGVFLTLLMRKWLPRKVKKATK
jgi:hypothetical protein